ncbi:MAG: 3'-5' exonuclease [Sporichthyaceae bacterium]
MGITLSREFAKSLDLDGSLKQRAWDFTVKVMTDPTAPGLHIEPIKGSRDPRVRTGRVNDNYRAVMFLVREGEDPEFVLAAIKKHDEANALAERIMLRVNPISGVLELDSDPEPAPDAAAASTIAPRNHDITATGPLAPFDPAELEAVGINPRVAAAAVAAATEDALLHVAGQAPPWQGEVLVCIATGMSIQDALQSLSLAAALPGERDADDDEGEAEIEAAEDAVERALALPASQMEFVRISSDDELRRILEGTFAQWRVFLHPEQRRYVRGRFNGAFRLGGGAGTGKTVVALHRARHLAERPDVRVILTTFTTTLADNLSRDLRVLDPQSLLAASLGEPGVLVRGIDKVALAVLSAVGSEVRAEASAGLSAGGGSLTPLDDQQNRSLWVEAAKQGGLTGDLASPTFLASEYRTIFLGNDVRTREAYLKVPRPGRGTRLNRAERLAVWQAVEVYRRRLALEQSASFAEIALVAARAADLHADRTGLRFANHVIVDEAQDLNPGHWRLLRSLVAEGPDDLFISEDSHQRIYGEKVTLSRFGIAVRGRSRRLTLNYRTTAENLQFALGILRGVDVTDIDGEADSTDGYRSAMWGPAPQLCRCDSLSDELDTVAEIVAGWLAEKNNDGENVVEPGSIGILARNAKDRDLAAQGLRDRALRAHVVAGSDTGRSDAPRLMTMHRAKGLEFSRVILFRTDAAAMPSEWALKDTAADERQDILDRERFLLYVAASRARDLLVVTWHGERSPFLPTTSAT